MPFDLAAIGAGLPALDLIEAVKAIVVDSGAVVVQAPPGSGKTTLIPPLVANGVRGRVVVTQPRRITARAAARRLASLTDTPMGKLVGYTVRGESCVSASARVEFVTAGVLVRRLLADPDLSGVGAVILDEVHERQLDADLAFAMVREVRSLRSDLAVVAMSATLDAERWAMLLGEPDAPARVVSVPALLHPLEVQWAPPPQGVARLGDRGVTAGFLDHVASATVAALAERADGDALVFLPGVWEVGQVVGRLCSLGVDAIALHGSLSAREQDRALAPGPSRRVIVSTAVAESSLTVPGVRIVIDAGLAREPRLDRVRGMAGLVTVSQARSSAEQRAGRAARLGPGLAVRCFSAEDWPRMRGFVTAEILTSDLTAAALVLASWGAPGGFGLSLPDAPPAAALALATDTLRGLGALDASGAVTASGRRMARMPVDPRLARALLAGAEPEGVALLSLDERAPGGDLDALLRSMRRGEHAAAERWRRETKRLAGLAGTRPPKAILGSVGSMGSVVAQAYPDRIARRRAGEESTAYLLACGTGADLEGSSALRGQEWLAIAVVGRGRATGGSGAVIRAAAPITVDQAREAGAVLLRSEEAASWSGAKVTTRRITALGAIELTSTPITPTAELGRAAVVAELSRQGLALLGWTSRAQALRHRMAFLHSELGASWPDVSDAALASRALEWLSPELDALAQGRPRSPIGVDALRRLLPWEAAAQLDALAPERMRVPSGSDVTIEYPELDAGQRRPIVAVKLQECFGLESTPLLAGGRVPVLMHLLSPARRPLAVTDDLASFWRAVYPQVRAENRGRYSKHPWPEDPWNAPPQRGTTRSGR